MAKQRFRTIKQKKSRTKKQMKLPLEHYASVGLKIKAFLTDSFMLVLPIMYIVFYLIMGSRESFADNMLMGWIYILVPLVIVQSIFFYRTGQTPGYRAYELTLIDEKTQERPSLFTIVFRNIAAILSLLSFLGWALMFFRKDNKTLHDLLSETAVVYKK